MEKKIDGGKGSPIKRNDIIILAFLIHINAVVFSHYSMSLNQVAYSTSKPTNENSNTDFLLPSENNIDNNVGVLIFI